MQTKMASAPPATADSPAPETKPGVIKTYGEKPRRIQIEKDKEWYYIGSEVC
jgi:hypothetical protein